ncbi:MAG: glycosyltransferase family 2 protein [Candidatus Latescibacteria bacterium]|nr:glycosyltransferase family 2 protein [Candidatus Latescibacterota bacterium]
MDLTIIIPGYNEEKRIGLTLEQSVAYLSRQSWRWEIIVVDDGSADQMAGRVEEFARTWPMVRALRHTPNRGKGYAIRQGVAAAQGRYIGFTDADYKTDIAALGPAMELLEGGCDGVIGDRTLSRSRIAVPRRRYRQLGTRLFKGVLLKAMGLGGFGDTQCGFKFFRAEVMRDLFGRQRVDGYMFDVEILLLSVQAGYHIEGLAVEWRDDSDSRFKPLSGTWRNLRELARIRWMHRNS